MIRSAHVENIYIKLANGTSHYNPTRGDSAHRDRAGISSAIGTSLESGHGLLKTTNEHLTDLKSKLQRLQTQLKSSQFDRLEAYGSLNSTIADVDKMKRDMASKFSYFYLKRQEQRNDEREANRILEDRIEKLKAVQKQAYDSPTIASTLYSSKASSEIANQEKIIKILSLLHIEDAEALIKRDIYQIESEVKNAIDFIIKNRSLEGSDSRQGFMTHQNELKDAMDQTLNLRKQNQELKNQLKLLEEKLESGHSHADGQHQKRLSDLEFENKKLLQWKKQTEIDSKRLLEEEKAKNERTMKLLEERIEQLEKDYDEKLQYWKNVAEEHESKLHELQNERSETQKSLVSKLNDQELKHKLRTNELESKVGALTNQVKHTEKLLETCQDESRQKLEDLHKHLQEEFQQVHSDKVQELENRFTKVNVDLQQKLERTEKSRTELLQQVQTLESSLNRAEVHHKEEISNLKDQLLAEGTKKLRNVEEGLKEQENKTVQPYINRIDELEKFIKELRDESSATTKTYQARLEQMQTTINDLIQEKNSLEVGLNNSLNQKEAIERLQRISEEKVSTLEKEISILKSTITRKDKELSDTQKENSSAIKELEEKLNDAVKHKEILESSAVEKEKDLEGRQQQAIESMKEDLKKEQKENKALKTELEQLHETCEGLKNQLSAKVQVLEEEHVKWSSLHKMTEEQHQTAVADLQGSVDSLTSNILTLNNIIGSLEKQLKDSQAEIDILTEEKKVFLSELRDKEHELAQSKNTYEGQIADLELKIQNLQKGEEDKIKTITADLHSELVKQNARSQELESLLSQISSERDSKILECQELARTTKELQGKVADSEKMHKELMQSLEENLLKVSSISEELTKTKQSRIEELTDSTRSELDKLKQDVEKSLEAEKQEISQAKARIKQIVEDTERKEKEAQVIMEEAEKIKAESLLEKAEILKLRDELSKTHQENLDMIAEIEKQKAILKEKDKDLKVTQEALRHQADDVNVELNQIKESEKIISDIQKSVWEEQQFLEEKNQMIRTLEEAKETLESKIKTLESENLELKQKIEQQKTSFQELNDVKDSIKDSIFHEHQFRGSQDNLLGTEFQRPTGALLSSPVMGGLKTIMTNSFDLDDNLDKSFDLKESLIIPQGTPDKRSHVQESSDEEVTKLKARLTQLEKQKEAASRRENNLDSQLSEMENKVEKLTSERAKLCSEKKALENLLQQIGLEKKTLAKHLIAEIKKAEESRDQMFREYEKDFEKKKTLDMERIESELKAKYESLIQTLKSEAALSPSPQKQFAPPKKTEESDDMKNSWIESEEEDSSPKEKTQENKKQSPYIGKKIAPHPPKFEKEPEIVYTARSVPDKKTAEYERKDQISSRNHNPEEKRGKKYHDTDYQKKQNESTYFVKKTEVPKEEPNFVKKSELHVEKGSPDSKKNNGGKPPLKTEKYYIRKSDSVADSDYKVKDSPREPISSLVQSHVQESQTQEATNSPEKLPTPQPVSKSTVESKEMPKPQAPPFLLSDLINPDDLEENEDEEWYGFNTKGKSNAVKDQEESSQKEELRSDLASSQFISHSGKEVLSKKSPQPEIESKSQGSSKRNIPTEEKAMQESMLWSTVLKDDNFDNYYNEDKYEDDQMRGSTTERFSSQPDEERTSTEKKKKKKKKTKEEVDISRLISPRQK